MHKLASLGVAAVTALALATPAASAVAAPGSDTGTNVTSVAQKPKAKKKFKIKKSADGVQPNIADRLVLTAKGLKGKTKFEVYDSALTVSTTTLTCDISTPTSSTPLSGSVRYKGGPATTGFVDFYQDGNITGGSSAPTFLGFESFSPAGSGQFNSGTDFCRQITSGTGLAGGNTPNFGPGTYNFQAYYTADSGFDDYISSNFLVVTVVP